MANVRPRGDKFVYKYTDPAQPWKLDPKTGAYLISPKTGQRVRNQIQLTFDTEDEANAFRLTKELDLIKGTYITPSDLTVAGFSVRFVQEYGKKHWSSSTYVTNQTFLKLHILPELGRMLIRKVTPLMIEQFMSRLELKKCAGPKGYNGLDHAPALSPKTRREILGLVKLMFNCAVEWEIISKNPVKCDAPKKVKYQRQAWTKRDIHTALENTKDKVMELELMFGFFLTLRNGEANGIQVQNINFLQGDYGIILIDRTIQRLSDEALKECPPDEIYLRFPKKAGSKSTVVLKTPKSGDSTRLVYMDKHTSELVLARMAFVERQRQLYKDDYHDYGLLLCQDNGDPIEPNLCEKRFLKWQKRHDLGLPKVEFHGLRASSITYKTMVSGGDIKAVGAGAGHASTRTTEGYLVVFDERRQEIMRLVESDFFGDANSVDDDTLLTDDGKLSVDVMQSMAEERLGRPVAPPSEFDSAYEYLSYILDEMQKRSHYAKVAS